MKQKTVIFLIYPGFELLDLSGPMSVFATANALAKKELYRLCTLAADPGLVTSGAGLPVYAEEIDQSLINSMTTILTVGADAAPLQKAAADTRLITWLSAAISKAERYGSVCTGTFLLHATGELKDKTITTHWAGCTKLGALSKDTEVLQDALYHIDGRCWTSAGVTTGIDMALEMLKQDHGPELMQSVAKYLVVYSQRPGKQSQFAQVQDMRPNEEDSFAELITWLKNNVTRPIKLAEMADQMCMSERNFQRKFSTRFSCPPSRFFERMRMEHARDFLLPKYSVKTVAHMLGYRSIAAFRTGFEKHFGISPSTSKKLR